MKIIHLLLYFCYVLGENVRIPIEIKVSNRQAKIGICPYQSKTKKCAFSRSLNYRIFECEFDYQCPNSYKCCHDRCLEFKICKEPEVVKDSDPSVLIISTTPAHRSNNFNEPENISKSSEKNVADGERKKQPAIIEANTVEVKPGNCPYQSRRRKCTLNKKHDYRRYGCSVDHQCPENYKCCDDFCLGFPICKEPLLSKSHNFAKEEDLILEKTKFTTINSMSKISLDESTSKSTIHIESSKNNIEIVSSSKYANKVSTTKVNRGFNNENEVKTGDVSIKTSSEFVTQSQEFSETSTESTSEEILESSSEIIPSTETTFIEETDFESNSLLTTTTQLSNPPYQYFFKSPENYASLNNITSLESMTENTSTLDDILESSSEFGSSSSNNIFTTEDSSVENSSQYTFKFITESTLIDENTFTNISETDFSYSTTTDLNEIPGNINISFSYASEPSTMSTIILEDTTTYQYSLDTSEITSSEELEDETTTEGVVSSTPIESTSSSSTNLELPTTEFISSFSTTDNFIYTNLDTTESSETLKEDSKSTSEESTTFTYTEIESTSSTPDWTSSTTLADDSDSDSNNEDDSFDDDDDDYYEYKEYISTSDWTSETTLDAESVTSFTTSLNDSDTDSSSKISNSEKHEIPTGDDKSGENNEDYETNYNEYKYKEYERTSDKGKKFQPISTDYIFVPECPDQPENCNFPNNVDIYGIDCKIDSDCPKWHGCCEDECFTEKICKFYKRINLDDVYM